MRLILKTILFTLLIAGSAFIAKAQLGYNYSQYGIGVAAGFDQVYGDAQTQTTTQSIHFNFTFNASPYTNFIFEAQLGKLAGGDSLKNSSGKQFNNDFNAFLFRGQLQFGEFLDYDHSPFNNAIKNLYISAGVGYIVNHITSINRYSLKNPTVYIPGENSSNEPFLPLRIGYEFKIFNKYQQPSTMIDLGYQFNYIFGDGLDGYSAGKHNDSYSQYCIGIKFAVGGAIISYRKQIPY